MSLSSTDKGLLTPGNCAVLFIDHQPQMFFGVASIDRQDLLNNVLDIIPLIVGGTVNPVVERVYPLAEAGEALRHLTEDRPFGKVVLANRGLRAARPTRKKAPAAAVA